LISPDLPGLKERRWTLAPPTLSHLKAAWRTARHGGVAALARKVVRRAAVSARKLVAGAGQPTPREGVNVAVHANWDVGAAIRYLTPGGTGRWGPVLFQPPAQISRPDLVLILNSPREPVSITLPPERIWFAAGEPPGFGPYHAGQGQGTVLVTCDAAAASAAASHRDVILAPPVLRTWHVERSLDELAAMRMVAKTRTLSWVTPDKDALPGHKLRMFFLRAISGKIPLDLYGRGFEPIPDKWDGIAPYRCSIAFENTRSPHYFTEKVMDCFVCLTLPLYYGSPELHRYFPAKSFVPIEPGDPRTLDRMREVIAGDLWRERLDALEEAKWLVLYKYNMFSQLSRLMLDRLRPAGPAQPLEIDRVLCEHG
jgi:hypothetical protein